MHTRLSWDWKSSPSLEDLQRALAPFGVIVTEDPRLERTDSYGYLFSDAPLSKEELREILNEED